MEKTLTFSAGGVTYPIAGCIFDFDGVVVDTEKYHYLSWLEGAKNEGCTLSWEDYLPLKSTGCGHIARYILSAGGKPLTEAAVQRICDIKESAFHTLVADLSEQDILPGMVEFLVWLQEKGIPAAVASSSHASCALAKRFGLDKYFKVLIDGNTKLPRKPAPDTFLLAAKDLGVDPGKCIVFEDSLAGIGGAVNAKMPVVAVGGIRSADAAAHVQDFTAMGDYFK